jgi:hypothetical protein
MTQNSPDYTTTCTLCHEDIAWVEEHGDGFWVAPSGYEGCPDPQQPDAGIFPHEPADDSAYWAWVARNEEVPA